ncbi:uncharacterized protein [Fopius arisanus]|uniref:Uncharacterized protein isoform X2 n=1 Tax=Fopius arisanus TaxID=64838 RepID=A0A9R1UAG8_9HYME|nr:PREDICTED: uncharacterized protein LOC105273505 isoform X2 [Fopius arisanus]
MYIELSRRKNRNTGRLTYWERKPSIDISLEVKFSSEEKDVEILSGACQTPGWPDIHQFDEYPSLRFCLRNNVHPCSTRTRQFHDQNSDLAKLWVGIL